MSRHSEEIDMHHLDRSTIPIPRCLAAPTEGRTYAVLTNAEREEIRKSLLELQGHRCAYCERRTAADRDDGHIEHFLCQAEHKNLSLSWSNIYWSCKDEKTCGKHKDKCTKQSGRLAKFDHRELLDPGADDPSQYLLFVVDGTVRPREELDPASRRRAEETLRVFRLAESAYLQRARQDAVKPYLSTIKSLMEEGREMVTRYIQSQMAYVDDSPFSTAIRQYLEGFLPE
jgi:uncharacterized protein (TIGR02646 family)